MELQLLTLGELAGNAVGNAVEAVVEHDDKRAERVVAGDDEIDRIYLELDNGILSLALQAPVAADLRLVSVIMHSSLHLERIGDQAVNGEGLPGHQGHAPERRSCSRSARWGTSWSRWCASRWTRSAAATSSSAPRCRRWTTPSTA